MLVVFCQPSRNIATITRALEHGWCVARIRTTVASKKVAHETIDSNVDDHEAMIWVMNSALNAMKSAMRVAIDVLISTISCHFSTEGAKSDAFRSPLNLAVVYHPIIILLFRQTHVHATIKRCPHAGIARLARTPFHTADV
jgi:hypothetical protein